MQYLIKLSPPLFLSSEYSLLCFLHKYTGIHILIILSNNKQSFWDFHWNCLESILNMARVDIFPILSIHSINVGYISLYWDLLGPSLGFRSFFFFFPHSFIHKNLWNLLLELFLRTFKIAQMEYFFFSIFWWIIADIQLIFVYSWFLLIPPLLPNQFISYISFSFVLLGFAIFDTS